MQRPLPAIGAWAFIVLLLGIVLSVFMWDWRPLALGTASFVGLAVYDAFQVGRGE
jgi:hypothetical protein